MGRRPQTVLVVAARQIIGSGPTCVHCDKRAVATIATGADPEPEPMCGQHAAGFLASAAAVLEQFDRAAVAA